MPLKQEPTLGATISASNTPAIHLISNPTAACLPTTTIPTSIGLKPSYLILDEVISCLDAIRILGRLVSNVKCPLAEYSPVQAIPGAWIPGLDESSTKPSEDALKSSGSSGAFSNRTLTYSEVAGDNVDFAQELEKHQSILVFSNLPFTISSSTTATITHSSQYSKKTSSLLTAMLGISISSSVNLATTYRLDSSLIRTLSLTQQDLVWAALLRHDEYKRDVMTAVRRNGGKMFLVIGVKVARDADVQKNVTRGRVVNGKLQVDVATGVGVQGLASVGVNIGVLGSHAQGVFDEGSRKERLSGDRAFAMEYREVRLRFKWEMEGSKGREDKKEREKNARNSKPLDAAQQQQPHQAVPLVEAQEEIQAKPSAKQWAPWRDIIFRRFSQQSASRPQPCSGGHTFPTGGWNSTPNSISYGTDDARYFDSEIPVYDRFEKHSYDYINKDKRQIDIYGDDGDYELELGEEVYVQDIDALW
ncbi:hypothetical protein BGX38DRAFT_1143600 [Terfezia claveryi]|nr:hypothetical protein BGX38DRAFT_1143600 [Terfezia claveryi]